MLLALSLALSILCFVLFGMGGECLSQGLQGLRLVGFKMLASIVSSGIVMKCILYEFGIGL